MPKTRIIFYGSSAGFPTESRDTSCVGLWHGADLILLDAGEPASAHFSRYNIPAEALKAVLVSHTHVDHLGGLPMLLQWLQMNERKEPLFLALPAEAISTFRDYLELLFLYPDLLGFDLEYKSVAPGRVMDRHQVVAQAFSNRHLATHAERLRREGKGRSGQSFSYLLTVEGSKLLYSGDLRDPSEITELADRADLALVEMAHYTPEELGQALAQSKLPKLVLTHLLAALEPEEEELPARIRKAGFAGEVLVAHDGDEIVL